MPLAASQAEKRAVLFNEKNCQGFEDVISRGLLSLNPVVLLGIDRKWDDSLCLHHLLILPSVKIRKVEMKKNKIHGCAGIRTQGCLFRRKHGASIKDIVRPSVGLSVGPLVSPSVPILLFPRRAHTWLEFRSCYHALS
jgi:hypothetical protein